MKIHYGGDVYRMPQIICLTEFKPNKGDMLGGFYERQVFEVFEGKFWFVPQPTNATHGGICFVDANSIASDKPKITTKVVDRMYEIEVGMHEDLRLNTKVYGVYGSNVPRERMTLQPKLMEAITTHAVITVINGTTSPFDTIGLAIGGNEWKWLRDKENDHSISDTFKAQWAEAHPDEHWPMTRVRGHQGKSYIDKVYVTRKAAIILSPTDGGDFPA